MCGKVMRAKVDDESTFGCNRSRNNTYSTYFVPKLRLCVFDAPPILYSKQLIEIRKLLS